MKKRIASFLNNSIFLIELFKRYRFSGINLFIKNLLGNTKNIKLRTFKYPFSIRKNTSDITVFKQVFLEGQYDFKIDFVPETIIDCGANIGFFSIYCKNKFPGCKIITVEPDLENFSLLIKNLKEFSNMQHEHAGVWSKKTKLGFNSRYKEKWGHVVHEISESNNGDELNSITIDEIYEKNNIEIADIIKLDIEGAEKDLFTSNYSGWLPKVKILIIELHDNIKPGSAQIFFKALLECIPDFVFDFKGENLIIYNQKYIK